MVKETKKGNTMNATERLETQVARDLAARTPEQVAAAEAQSARIAAYKKTQAANKVTPQGTAGRTYRMIDENDASMFGSKYLGREGVMAWMPR